MNFSELRIKLRAGLWVIPTVLVTAAVGLAILLLQFDAVLGQEFDERVPWLGQLSAEGVRSILSSIATSMMTVAGVVFSITVVVLSLAASQYTSRVLRNFMRDRSTQTVLGVFVGVFAYCIVVLGAVHGDTLGDRSIPVFAITVGVILAFVAIGFLIYFIHHIASSVQLAQIIAAAGSETRAVIDREFPDEMHVGEEEHDRESGLPAAPWRAVPARSTGYIQAINEEALSRCADEADLVVGTDHHAGSFVVAGTPLLMVAGAREQDPDTDEQLLDCISISDQRTPEQDPAFGIRQIVDVALRGLSPGVNDPTEAVMCLNELSAILALLVRRRRRREHGRCGGRVRLVPCRFDFAGFAHLAFAQIRQNADGQTAVLKSLLVALDTVARHAPNHTRLAPLLQETRGVLQVIERSVPDERDCAPLVARARALIARLEGIRTAQEHVGALG